MPVFGGLKGYKLLHCRASRGARRGGLKRSTGYAAIWRRFRNNGEVFLGDKIRRRSSDRRQSLGRRIVRDRRREQVLPESERRSGKERRSGLARRSGEERRSAALQDAVAKQY